MAGLRAVVMVALFGVLQLFAGNTGAQNALSKDPFASLSSSSVSANAGTAIGTNPLSQDLTGFDQQAEFLPVEEAYPLAVERVADNQLRLIWQMPPGYYLYKHAFRFDALVDGSSVALEANYPEFLVREDEYFGRVEVYYDGADITLTADRPIQSGTLSVMSQGCADAGLCYPPRTQQFSLDSDGTLSEIVGVEKPLQRTAASSAKPQRNPGFWAMLAAAFVGGLILNLMPCVLPILSLKVLSFACSPIAERRRHGALYSLGVMTSFVAVALALFALRSAGQAIGWGFQLQSPGFVTALAYLFIVLGLSLSGVVQLGSRFMNIGGSLANRGDATGSFFTGVLAVVVASPCTAPFMGSALGYAMVQPPLTGTAIFLALGAGMALPMFLLSYSESARALLPKPGPWMETLSQILAFPLYATAIWLLWVAGRQVGVDFMAVALLGALLLSLGLWLWRPSILARGTAIASIALALVLASWRPAVEDTAHTLPAGSIAYSSERLNELRSRGQAVFVDVTADWCLTCLANERTVLSASSVQQAFAESNVVYMVADWTDYDSGIAEFVASHGRSGIPLYVLYQGEEEPKVLPQLLRRQVVIDALRDAATTQLAQSTTTEIPKIR